MTTLRRVLTRKSVLSVGFPVVWELLWKLLVVVHTAEFFKSVLTNAFRSPQFAAFVVSDIFATISLLAGVLAGVFFELREKSSLIRPLLSSVAAKGEHSAVVDTPRPLDELSNFQGIIEGADTFILSEKRTLEGELTRTIRISRGQSLPRNQSTFTASSRPNSPTTHLSSVRDYSPVGYQAIQGEDVVDVESVAAAGNGDEEAVSGASVDLGQRVVVL